MALVTRFETPGRLRDLPEDSSFYDRWSERVRQLLKTKAPGAGGLGGFFNPSETDVQVVGHRDLVWMGFPRGLLVGDHPGGRQAAFAQGDTRGAEAVVPGGQTTQAEYLEWRVTRRPGDGKVTKVTFTTETPEYWEALFRAAPGRVVELYRELVGDQSIVEADLADPSGVYNPLNPWNTERGIVHYIVERPANTLCAAIELARDSVGGELVPDNYELDGFAETSADPRVDLDVKAVARKGLWVTLREPIGVYMVGWDDTGWTKPDGSPVGNYWRVVRPPSTPGGPALRLEYQVPAEEGFVVGDVSIGGRRIEYGGQLAEHITVLIGGLAGRLP
jgi:hypothetical protein